MPQEPSPPAGLWPDEDGDTDDNDLVDDGGSASAGDQGIRRHPVTRDVPQIWSHPPFWSAGANPAGFDDPAWKQTIPFTTFDDVLEVAGSGDGNGST